MAATAVDTAAIASTFEYDEPKLRQILDAPTADLVKDLLLILTSKAGEIDDAKAELVRKDVELENAFRSNESRIKTLKATANRAAKENEELRSKISAEESTCQQLRTELDRIRSSSNETVAETESLHSRISALEAANREAVTALEAKTTSNDKLADDLAAQQQRTIALKLEIATLEEKCQSFENAAASARFKEQTLSQELDLLKRNNDWHEQELKARGAEHAKFRKERNARISELQRTNEEANTTIDALRRTETALRQQIDSLTLKTESAFAKIQRLEVTASDAEKNFSAELSSANRLAELQRQSADTARSRLSELQDSIESIKDAAAAEVGQLQAEIETERSDKLAAEQKISELEQEVERLSEATAVASVPGTPARSLIGASLATPRRPSSSAQVTPGSIRHKGNLSFTQLVSEVNTLRSDLELERRRNTSLTAELDSLIQDLESRGPEQEESRLERERIEAEVVEMSSLLDRATSDRDNAVDDLREREGRIKNLESESAILRQQLRDLSAQVKLLLVEMQAREQGLESLDAAGQAQLQMLVSTGGDEPDTNQTSAGALITQRLLLFKNIAELQEQNVQLLRLNRGLADRMEGDAAKARDAQESDNLRELEELRTRVQRYQDEIKNMTSQADGIMRERDMFRRMLSHRGPLAANANIQAMFAQSVDGRSEPPRTPNGHTNGAAPQTPGSTRDSEYAKLVKDLQSHLDATRTEASISHNTLKEQLTTLTREKTDAQSEAVKANGQLSLAHERYELLQTNYRMVQAENGELQKRTQKLSENAAVQDLRTQQVAEELIEAKGLAESMRTETANLKAERELWKRVETRLTEDNNALREDKSRLNKMYANLQNLQNEREIAESESKRKLRSRVDFLDGELDSLRKKLEAEVDDNKKASLRRDYELEQNKTRIDELLAGHAAAREELVSVKTIKQQAEARVEELKIELHSAQERIDVLQPRLPPPESDNAGGDESGVTTEQTLRSELSDAKRDLELAQNELQKAFAEVEQYKSISQATEEELQSLVETNDQYREEMDAILAEKEAKITQLERRIEDINSELSTTNKQLSELRLQHDDVSRNIEQEKRGLETEIARLRDETERQSVTARLCQEDLKAQAEIAQQAQQSYEDELLKHADAAKNLHTVRDEYKSLRNEVAAIKTEAEAAKISLSQNEESWNESRERYERELAEINLGRQELLSQNKLLHEQLENVTTQVTSLQQQRASTDTATEQTDSGDHGLASLQEVIKYLRREKEIVDVQYEMSVQESKRLRQQLDYVQGQLDDSRQKLDEERRAQTDRENTTSNHTQLLQTITELNLYRESSATLRQEARQAQTQLQEKIKELESITSQLLPLQAQVRQAEEENQTKNGEMKLLEEDRDMWRERTQNIISKYDRVDPAEMESLKTQLATLQTEKEELVSNRDEMQSQLDAVPTQIQEIKNAAEQDWQGKRANLIEQAKARSREQAAKLRESERELAAMRDERDRVQQQLSEAQTTVEAITAERDQAVADAEKSTTAQENVADGQEDGEVDQTETEGGQTTLGPDEIAALNARAEEAEATLAIESERATQLSDELATAQARVVELEEQVATLQQGAQQVATDSIPSIVTNEQDSTAKAEHSGELDTVKAELASAQQELEQLRATTNNFNQDSLSAVTPNVPSADIAAQVVTEVERIKQQLEAEHEERRTTLAQEQKQRIDNMKNQLRDKLKESREKARVEVRAELVDELNAEIAQLKEQHQNELKQLQESHELAIKQLEADAEAIKQNVKQDETTVPVAAKAENEGEAAVKPSEDVLDISARDVNTIHFSEAQLRELAMKNQWLRDLISKNIQSRLRRESAQLNETHEKAMQVKVAELEEAHKKAFEDSTASANQEKEQAISKAVAMEGMKQKAKLGMAEGSARATKAKLQVVETAAKETPQKPVVEVWEVAKVAKPAPAPAGPAPPTGTPSKPATASTAPAPIVTAAVAAAAPASPSTGSVPAAAEAKDEQADRLAARQARFGAPSAPGIAQPSAPPSAAGSFGKPSLPVPGSTAGSNAPNTATTTPAEPATATPSATGITAPRGAAAAAARGIPRAGSMLPRGGRGGGRGGLPQPTAGASAQQASAPTRGATSGLPRGGMLRGSGVAGPRGGRGGGGGRGGPVGGPFANAATSLAANGNSSGDTATPSQTLNAGATQFTPQGEQQQASGAKRPLQDGGAAAQGDEKRVKGPGPGA